MLFTNIQNHLYMLNLNMGDELAPKIYYTKIDISDIQKKTYFNIYEHVSLKYFYYTSRVNVYVY